MPDPDNDPVRRSAPSAGEERALRSFGYQYDMVATYVYRALVDGTLRHVWIGDPNAGRADDGVIWVGSEIRGIQAKYASDSSYLTFREFCKITDGRSLAGDLYHGFTALRNKFQGRPVFVYLTTTLRASHADAVPGTSMNFESFIADVLANLASDAEDKYPEAFAKLREATGNPEDLNAFLAVLRFDLNAWPDNRGEGSSVTRAQDVGDLAALLLDLRTQPDSGPADFSTTTLLGRIGWLHRAFPANVHVFPLDPQEYEPLTEAIAALESLVNQHEQKYVALLGPPGSGKSTLIQDLSAKLPDRVVRYFAFVRDVNSIRPRGEALNFLHDVVSQLRENGLPYGDSLLSDDLMLLREALRSQLRGAAEDFACSGRRTVIVIDGLDHVNRDPSIRDPLLRELPAPSVLGRGVILLIASQTKDGLSPEIAEAIRTSTVDLANYRLSAAQVRSLSERVLGSQTLPFSEDIYQHSQGHPLGVSIMMNALRDARADQIQSILAEVPAFGPDVNAYYRGISAGLLKDGRLFDLLSTIVRIRRPIELAWLQDTWQPEITVRFTKHFFYLFRRSGGIWSFFHDSFRQYLAVATLEQYDPDCLPESEARLHSAVADRCATSQDTSIYVWEELYHRARAHQVDRVLDIAKLETFRSQYVQFRTPTAILADIAVAASVAAEAEDGLALWRTTLAAAEISQRQQAASVADVAIALLKLGDVSKALLYSSILEATPLPDVSERLALAGSFLELGRRTDALMLFDSIDPVRLVRGNGFFVGDFAPLRAWMRLAIKLRGQDFARDSHERLFSVVALERPPDDQRDARYDLNLQLAWGAIDAGDMEFPLFLVYKGDNITWDIVHAILRAPWHDEAKKREFVDHAKDLAGSLPVESLHRVQLARALHRAGFAEDALAVLGGIQRLETGARFDHVMEDYELHRDLDYLQLVSGRELPIVIEIPPSNDRNDRWLDSTIRRIALDVARVEYAATSGAGMSLHEFETAVEEITSRLSRPAAMRRYDGYFYYLEKLRPRVSQSLVDSAGKLGSSYLTSLASIWFERGLSATWASTERRRLIRQLNLAGVGAGQLLSLADAIDGSVAGLDASSLSDDISDAFDLRIGLKDLSKAKELLARRLRQSFGLGYSKDYQLSSFIGPLASIISVDLDRGLGAIRRLAGAAIALSDIVEGRAPMHFLMELVELLAASDLRYSTSLMQELADRRSVWWLAGLYDILLAGARSGEVSFGFTTRFFCEVLLPLDDDVQSDFVRAYANLLSVEDLEVFVQLTTDRVRTYSRANKRRGYLRELENASKRAGCEVPRSLAQAIEQLGVRSDDDRSEDDAIVISGPIANLFGQPHSRELAQSIENATEATGHAIRALAQQHANSSDVLIALAKKAAAVGESELAEEIDAMAVATLPSYAGWVRAHDGALREKLWEARVARGVAGAKVGALLDFASSLNVSPAPVLLIPSLSRLVAMSGCAWDALAAWKECEDYLSALLADVKSSDLELQRSELGVADWLIAQHIGSTALLIQEGIYRFLCLAASDGEDSVGHWLRRSVANSELRAVAINVLVASASDDGNSERLRFVVGSLERIVLDSSAGSDVEAALEALARIDVDPPVIVERVVPPIYQFASPMAYNAALDLGPAAGGLLSHIARLADVDESAVVRRAITLAGPARTRYQDLPDELSQENDDSRGLRRVLSTIIGELSVSSSVRDELLNICRFFDPDLLRVAAQPRPTFLPLPSQGLEEDSSDLGVSAVSFLGTVETLGASDVHILAEWSMGRAAPYGERLVTRQFAICELGSDQDQVLERVFDRKLADGAQHGQSRKALFFKNEAIALPHTRTAPWLGIHHVLLAGMNWRFDSSTLRYWASDGQMRARLTWWCDGQVGVNTRDSSDRSAIGWLIVGSREAVDDIAAVVGTLEMRCVLDGMGRSGGIGRAAAPMT
jgi:energy-coupling factor transporter ATP-binding protein EcfA2